MIMENHGGMISTRKLICPPEITLAILPAESSSSNWVKEIMIIAL
jgi:hypothetical protein